jgi:hypothetical protein
MIAKSRPNKVIQRKCLGVKLIEYSETRIGIGKLVTKYEEEYVRIDSKDYQPTPNLVKYKNGNLFEFKTKLTSL